MIGSPSLRLATEADTAELARLLSHLGYPTPVDAVAAIWEAWTAEGNFAVVAQGERSLIGVITLHRMVVLHRPQAVGRITSLVVEPSARGQGLGRALILAAEEALTSAGCGLLEVTSHARFADAHGFYMHLGFEQTSSRFGKVLS